LFDRQKLPFDFDDENSSSGFGGGYSSSYAKKMLSESKPKENVNADFSKYRSGAKVKHAKFGIGTIIAVKGEGDKIIADVAFPGVGIKALSVKFAPMEIL
jgi:DNA helicase-2/ATP-dependent DNA helicase PcrA